MKLIRVRVTPVYNKDGTWLEIYSIPARYEIAVNVLDKLCAAMGHLLCRRTQFYDKVWGAALDHQERIARVEVDISVIEKYYPDFYMFIKDLEDA